MYMYRVNCSTFRWFPVQVEFACVRVLCSACLGVCWSETINFPNGKHLCPSESAVLPQAVLNLSDLNQQESHFVYSGTSVKETPNKGNPE